MFKYPFVTIRTTELYFGTLYKSNGCDHATAVSRAAVLLSLPSRSIGQRRQDPVLWCPAVHYILGCSFDETGVMSLARLDRDAEQVDLEAARDEHVELSRSHLDDRLSVERRTRPGLRGTRRCQRNPSRALTRSRFPIVVCPTGTLLPWW